MIILAQWKQIRIRRSVWGLQTLQSQQDTGSLKENKNRIERLACVCQISAWFHCSLCGSAPSSSCGGCAQTYWFPLFCVLLWMKTGGDSEQGDETLLSAQRHGSAAPVAPLLSTLPLDSTGDSLQCTFYEPFSRFSALVLLLSCNMRESCFSFFVISFPGMTTVWYGHFVYNLIVIFHFVHKKILCWCISVMPSVWCPCVWSLLG